MYRILLALTIVPLTLGFAPAPKPKPKPKDPVTDMKALRGTWEMQTEAFGRGGKVATKTTVKIEDNGTWTQEYSGQGFNSVTHYKVTLNTTKKPTWIDLQYVQQGGFGNTYKLIGIVEVKGDTLKFRYAYDFQGGLKGGVQQATRPTDFTKGTGSIMTLKRIKP